MTEPHIRSTEFVFAKDLMVLEIEYPGLACNVPFYSSKENRMPCLMVINAQNKQFILPLDKFHTDALFQGLLEVKKQEVREKLTPGVIQTAEHVEELTYDREKA